LVRGNLTLDGTLQLAGVDSLASGNFTFPLLRFTGSLTNNGLQLGAVPPTFSGSIVSDAANKLVNLVATNTATGSGWLLTTTPNNSRALLVWSPIADAANYQIRRAVSAVGPFTNIVNLTTTNVLPKLHRFGFGSQLSRGVYERH
jgi:hypothetical protein